MVITPFVRDLGVNVCPDERNECMAFTPKLEIQQTGSPGLQSRIDQEGPKIP